jgi:hypothetical protein
MAVQSCGCAILWLCSHAYRRLLLEKAQKSRRTRILRRSALHSIEAALHTQVIHKLERCKHDVHTKFHCLSNLAMVANSHGQISRLFVVIFTTGNTSFICWLR